MMIIIIIGQYHTNTFGEIKLDGGQLTLKLFEGPLAFLFRLGGRPPLDKRLQIGKNESMN